MMATVPPAMSSLNAMPSITAQKGTLMRGQKRRRNLLNEKALDRAKGYAHNSAHDDRLCPRVAGG
jgi:hypothetical protein